ncbi:type II toxin-antitoxin system RelE/ParE family toxin [Acidiphilium sp.]|uniref:type II toxin-antitoxin system RelE/ParE family toxin n=1 Tax=Acidiphilium sp. TaxID=527 RepID=UPI00258F9468|nr:type II toxin-antitoxin system RelE/ParE family toxin [Acidiphilium sp.]
MNAARSTEMPVVFYRTAGGAEPVLDWLRGLPAEDRRVIGTDLATVQFGWPIGMPLCRPLGSRRIARVLFFAEDGRIGVVHGFIKKTQKTPADDLDLARRRMKEMKA